MYLEKVIDFINKEFLIFLLAFKFIVVMFVFIFNVPLFITDKKIVNIYTRYHFTLFITVESILNFIYIFSMLLISDYFNIKSYYQRILLLILIVFFVSGILYKIFSSQNDSFYNKWYKALNYKVNILTVLFTVFIYITYNYILNQVDKFQ